MFGAALSGRPTPRPRACFGICRPEAKTLGQAGNVVSRHRRLWHRLLRYRLLASLSCLILFEVTEQGRVRSSREAAKATTKDCTCCWLEWCERKATCRRVEVLHCRGWAECVLEMKCREGPVPQTAVVLPTELLNFGDKAHAGGGLVLHSGTSILLVVYKKIDGSTLRSRSIYLK